MHNVLNLYHLHQGEYTTGNYGNGLINTTWIITDKHQKYILQRINRKVFADPELIDENIQTLHEHLLEYRTDHSIIMPLVSQTGKTMVSCENEYYRLFKFIPSRTYLVATSADVAFEAAKQFGKFTKSLSNFNTDELYEPIPHFHDLNLRYTQFLQAIKSGDKNRIHKAEKIIESLKGHKIIVDAYNDIIQNPSFKKRVTHHDTKISNVLFDEDNKGIAVIDLDTTMPGYFISDVGDMLRTYLAAVSEEEINFDLIEIRDEYFKAIAQGYLSEMKEGLSAEEVNAFVYAGKFMIYMQALRFITDYLNNDIYYAAKYPEHNYNRAQNQLRLLECLIEKEEQYNLLVQQIASEF